ncbi:hypothetical protein D3C81_795180 [compost metagenome]
MFGSKVTQNHLKQWLFLIHHFCQVSPYRLSVDHRFPAPFEKGQSAHVVGERIALSERLLKRRSDEIFDIVDFPQQRAQLLTTREALGQCMTDLGQLIDRRLS